MIIWRLYSGIEALNLELGGDNTHVKPFTVEFHYRIIDRTEALWIDGAPFPPFFIFF